LSSTIDAAPKDNYGVSDSVTHGRSPLFLEEFGEEPAQPYWDEQPEHVHILERGDEYGRNPVFKYVPHVQSSVNIPYQIKYLFLERKDYS